MNVSVLRTREGGIKTRQLPRFCFCEGVQEYFMFATRATSPHVEDEKKRREKGESEVMHIRP